MSQQIRVLHVIGIMDRGGAEAMIMNLYRNIDRNKVQFDFVENSSEPAAFDEEILALGGKIYRCPHYNGKNHFSYLKWWNSFFQEHTGEYPIVHGHLGSTAAIYLSIAKKHNAYTIAHSHNTNAQRSMGQLIYNIFSYPTRHIADHFFACSFAAGKDRFGKKIGENPQKCQVFPNAIDSRKFVYNSDTRTTVRKKLGVDEDTILIGNVGRFAQQKNHCFLIDIFVELKKQSENAKLLLVGDGVLRAQIEKKIDENNLQNAVILTGVQADVTPFYQAMDLFLFPSLYEGLPVSVVEAQAAGLPCLLSEDVPADTAITELVQFLPRKESTIQWAQKALSMVRYANRTDTNAEIKKAGFDIVATAQWLENFYCEVACRETK